MRHSRLGVVDLLMRDQSRGYELLLALERHARVGEVGGPLRHGGARLGDLLDAEAAAQLLQLRPRLLHVRLGGGDVGGEGHAVELGERLACLDPVALLHLHVRDPAGDAECELHLMDVDVAEEGERGVGIVRPARPPQVPAHRPHEDNERNREHPHAGAHAARSVPRSCVSGVVVPPAPTARPPPRRSSSSSDNGPGAPDIVLGFTFRTRVPATNG